ncbi:MAG: DUF411 domain-containing protein [Gemmatimonadota bacterium]|nr:DUF411 domain-containing protein [Gemmatimonadota bacterium]
MRAFSAIMVLAFGSFAWVGCDDANASAGNDTSASPASDAAVAVDLPTVLVYKTPTCLCCNGWVEHLEAAGFTVDARNVSDLMTVKRDAGVPPQMSSCHTAIVDGYVVEGHVPAELMKDLLANRPDVAGIAAPGMPTGSPGMEGPNAKPYQVLSFTHDGEAAVYAEVDPR